MLGQVRWAPPKYKSEVLPLVPMYVVYTVSRPKIPSHTLLPFGVTGWMKEQRKKFSSASLLLCVNAPDVICALLLYMNAFDVIMCSYNESQRDALFLKFI